MTTRTMSAQALPAIMVLCLLAAPGAAFAGPLNLASVSEPTQPQRQRTPPPYKRQNRPPARTPV